jgi:hypothetical protein
MRFAVPEAAADKSDSALSRPICQVTFLFLRANT